MNLEGVETSTAVGPIRSVVAPSVSPASQVAALSEREREVLGMIGLGMSMSEIAKRLSRTVKTVEWYRASLGKKLRAKNRVQLARIAIASGLAADGSDRFAQPAREQMRIRVFEQALTAAQAYVWVWDDTQRRLDISDSIFALAGYTREDVDDVRFAWAKLSEPEALEELIASLHRALSSGGDSVDLPSRLVHKNGERLCMRSIGRIERDSRGVPIRWHGVAHMVERLPPAATPKPPLERIGVFEWDARDDRMETCPNCPRLFRAASGGIGERFEQWTAYFDGASRSALVSRWHAALASAHTPSLLLETPRRCGDGVTRRFEDRVVFLRDGQGKAMRAVGTVTLKG